MDLILHIGTEKTGSSYLQTLFALNRHQLQSEKIYYPGGGNREKDALKGKVNPGNGKTLFNLLRASNDKQLHELLLDYKKAASAANCDKILISNENLIEVLALEPCLVLFKTICRNLDIEIANMFLVIREPVDQAFSLYKHRAKNGLVPPLNEWVKRDYSLAKVLENFLCLTDAYSLNCTFRKYYKDPAIMAGMVFNDWLKINKPEMEHTSPVNVSLSMSELMFLKMLAKHNENWVEGFYNRMLLLPASAKAIDNKMEGHYKAVIGNELVQYNKTWNKINKVLGNKEKLNIPEKKILEESDDPEVFCFTGKQAMEITAFMAEMSSTKMKFALWRQQLRRAAGKKLRRVL